MSDDYEIPHIKDIMKFRMKMKADKAFAEEVRGALAVVSEKHGLSIAKEAIDSTILVHPEEVATHMSVPNLPVGSQCQAW